MKAQNLSLETMLEHTESISRKKFQIYFRRGNKNPRSRDDSDAFKRVSNLFNACFAIRAIKIDNSRSAADMHENFQKSLEDKTKLRKFSD